MTKDIKNSKTEHVQFSASAKLNFDEDYTETTGLPIGGFAVHEGIFKRVIEIPNSELGNVATALHNAQLRIDHSNSVRDIVGLVDTAEAAFDNYVSKEGVKYAAHIDDADIAQKVRDNKIRDVSIGFDFTPECSKCGKDFRRCTHWFDKAHIIARDVKVFELSLVTLGADPDAHVSTMSFMEQFSDKLNKEDFKGGNAMEHEKSVDVSGVVERATQAEKEAFEAKKEAEELTAKLAAAKAEKEQLEADKQALADEKAQLETEKIEIEEKFTKTSEKLSAKEIAAKKEEATEVAQMKLEKGLIKEEELEGEVERLMASDSLDQIKELVGQFVKEEEEKGAVVPPIQEFGKVTEKGEIDYDDPEVEQRFIHEIFAYDRVFKARAQDKIENQSYMGFSKHV